jgi:glyoxylase-like metal-dependent hydrolase (beta-lactamase superfamily II)
MQTLGPHTTSVVGDRSGTYPDGNSLLVRGSEATLLVDPSLTVHTACAGPDRGALGGLDVVVLSHGHEDHMAGASRFATTPLWVPQGDAVALGGLDGLLAVYGFPPGSHADFERMLLEDFHYLARPDAQPYDDGHVWDLGGVSVRAVHLPGHTRGHSGLLVEPDGVLYLGDIDLTGFGPYYGDAWSDLDAFRASLARCRDLDARWYATFHHKGAIEGRDAFLPMLDAFAAVIDRREAAILGFLAEAPRTLADCVAHRFVYRPHVQVPGIDEIERRHAELHLADLVRRGRVVADGEVFRLA